MEINQFEQFRAIAECGTMREAAERLYLSQPTLSYNLKKLEGELGCKLFVRAHNKLQLTAYGRIVHEYTMDLADRMGAMLADIEAERRRAASVMRIGCFSLLFSGFGMPQVAAATPDASYEVVHGAVDDLLAALGDGVIDALIAPKAPGRKGLKWKRVCSESAFLSAPKDSPEAALAKADGADLAGLRFTLEADLPGYSGWYRSLLASAGVPEGSIELHPFKEHLWTKDTLRTCNLITSFIMGYVHVSDLRRVVPIALAGATREIGLLYRPGSAAKLKPLLDYVEGVSGDPFGGNTFVPFFLFPEDMSNLTVIGGM